MGPDPGSAGKLPRWWIVPAAFAGIALLLAYWYPVRWRVTHGVNDFLNLYSGARLIGTPDQYNPARYRDVQIAATGFYGDSWLFTRLPAVALALRPLGRLPYQTAYMVWQTLSLAALGGFLVLWRTQNRAMLILLCCWSFPLTAAFASGQDDCFLLLWIGLALCLASKWPRVAGAVLALGAMKFHLFVLVPIALLAGRRWRPLAGFGASASAIFALCFVAAGPHWIGSYLRLVLNPVVNPASHSMPNLHGLFADLPFGGFLEISASMLVLAAVWRIAAGAGFEVGIAGALVGGILVSRHAYAADLVLLIPALWILSREFPRRAVRWLSAALLAPVWFILPISPLVPPVPLLLIALVATTIWSVTCPADSGVSQATPALAA